MDYQRGELVAEGKTKKVFRVVDRPDLLIAENKDDITKFDDPSQTEKLPNKAKWATTTTCNVFELFKQAGIPVAYQEQHSETEFVTRSCQPISLEVICREWINRRSSYCKRNPETTPAGDEWVKLREPSFELFLKTTDGRFTKLNGEVIDLGLERENGEEDPFIPNPDGEEWVLAHSKKPSGEPGWDLGRISRSDVVPSPEISIQIQEIALEAFRVLADAWAQLGWTLLDIKFEFGITADGRLVLIDVVDNDSWRILDPDGIDRSKQAFRDNKDPSFVATSYSLVAEASEKIALAA